MAFTIGSVTALFSGSQVNDFDFVRQGTRVAPAVMSFEKGIWNNACLLVFDLLAHATVDSTSDEVFTRRAGKVLRQAFGACTKYQPTGRHDDR